MKLDPGGSRFVRSRSHDVPAETSAPCAQILVSNPALQWRNQGSPVHHQLPEFTQNHFHWVSDAVQKSHSLSSLLLLPSIVPSIRVFSNESVLLIRWPKYRSLRFIISPSNEYSGLISLRLDWFDLLEIQGTLKSLLQHHNCVPLHGTQMGGK